MTVRERDREKVHTQVAIHLRIHVHIYTDAYRIQIDMCRCIHAIRKVGDLSSSMHLTARSSW